MLYGHILSFTPVNIGIIWNAQTFTYINSISQKWIYLCEYLCMYFCVYIYMFVWMYVCKEGFLVKIRGRDYKGCSLLPDWKQRKKSETLAIPNWATYRLAPGWLPLIIRVWWADEERSSLVCFQLLFLQTRSTFWTRYVQLCNSCLAVVGVINWLSNELEFSFTKGRGRKLTSGSLNLSHSPWYGRS